jgi:indolepyruvate ferredoxin oxidoreductase, alpha subunit
MGKNFSKEVLAQLRYGEGQTLTGDAALIVLKALLESGVSYLGGYPGAPTSGLYDAISDSYDEILAPMGIHFEGSTNEAAAAALLQASVNNKVRGCVNWKVVGNNVAADALAHIAHPGLTGGAMAIVGEDYGLNSTSIAEKTLPYCHKSGMICVDPRGDAGTMAHLIRQSFELSEFSGTIVMYLLRTRTGNLKGTIACQDNKISEINTHNPLKKANNVRTQIAIPPYSAAQERRKFQERLPAARQFIRENKLNEVFAGTPEMSRVGIITHGMLYNTTVRSLEVLGEASVTGECNFPIMCLNVIHPLVPDEIVEFVRDKDQVLIIEEGMPNDLEIQIRAIVQSEGLHHLKIYGKDVLPEAGEYTPLVLVQHLSKWLTDKVYANANIYAAEAATEIMAQVGKSGAFLSEPLPDRLPLFCTGCPERPIFTALKIAEKEHNAVPHYAGDIGCYIMGAYAPFSQVDTCTGMGTGLASAGALSKFTEQNTVAFLGDGTFWHSGLTTSVSNAVFNDQAATMVVFENGWTSMTGQQENPNNEENARHQPFSKMDIGQALKAAGVKKVVEVNPYHVGEVVKEFDKAFVKGKKELTVIRSVGECQLEKGRREKVEKKEALAKGKTVTDSRFGIDDNLCTGDHSCIRLNGCPSLTVKDNPNPIREEPIATINRSCVGCGLCGELAHAAVLCPSFYEATVVTNPSRLTRWKDKFSRSMIKFVFGVQV